MYKLLLVNLLGSNPRENPAQQCTPEARCGFLTCQVCVAVIMERVSRSVNARHVWNCEYKMAGNCQICDHLAELNRQHAEQCQVVDCSVPFCETAKQRLRETGANTAQRVSSDTDTSQQDTREWTHTLTADLRNRFVHELVKTIIPAPIPEEAMRSEGMNSLVEHARTIEESALEMAQTRSQYYQKILDTMSRLRQDMEGRRFANRHDLQVENETQN